MMKRFTKYIIMGVFLGGCLLSTFLYGKQLEMQRHLAEKVLRFHVLANSDSIEDQNLKQKVRDTIGSYMQENMEGIGSKEDCEKFITESMQQIRQCAEEVIWEEGFDYEVQTELTNCYFPVKSYGNYTFPKGRYDALRIIIGEGKGRNWWCVMYPNMCFVNSLYKVTDERSQKALQEVLEEEEYETVLNSGKYKIRFKFLSWL